MSRATSSSSYREPGFPIQDFPVPLEDKLPSVRVWIQLDASSITTSNPLPMWVLLDVLIMSRHLPLERLL